MKTVVTITVELHESKEFVENRLDRQGGKHSVAQHFEDAAQMAIDQLGKGFTAYLKTDVKEQDK